MGGNMNYLENLQYEFRPFVYLVMGICFMKNNGGSNIVFNCSAMLILIGLFILRERYEFRYGRDETHIW
jgi:hypothetical protein